VLTVALSVAGAASAQTSFYVYLTSASIPSYTNTLQAHAWAYYRNSECTQNDPCDSSVVVQFTLRRGYRTVGSVMLHTTDRAAQGQYGSNLNASFELPDCRLMKKNASRAFTVETDAVAPDGPRRHSTRTVYQRSCKS